MSWFYIFIASLFEICWAVGLKYSEGFTRITPTIFSVTTMLLSFVFLSMGSKNLPIGTAYAIWTGIGAAGTVIYGMLFLNEPKDFLRIFFVFLIIAGVAGLRLSHQTNS
ncbi:MAG: multidrug efflux SMR transporter [Ignavibacteriales bacterium]|nr:multidrug efflux SMR transporter [Ignavibacteriales bacterium]